MGRTLALMVGDFRADIPLVPKNKIRPSPKDFASRSQRGFHHRDKILSAVKQKNLGIDEFQFAEGSWKRMRGLHKALVSQKKLGGRMRLSTVQSGESWAAKNMKERGQQGGISEGQSTRRTYSLSNALAMGLFQPCAKPLIKHVY